MTILHLLIVTSVALILINNIIFSRAYRRLTGKVAGAINFQGLLKRSVNDWVKDPLELDAFGKLSNENRIAVAEIKQESARRNCVSFAVLIVAFITPRVIWRFPLIPQSNDQLVSWFFCLVSILVDFTFWSRWLKSTYDEGSGLHLFSVESVVTFLMAIVATVAWHFITNWLLN